MVWHGNCQVSPASVHFMTEDDGMVCKWEPTMYGVVGTMPTYIKCQISIMWGEGNII